MCLFAYLFLGSCVLLVGMLAWNVSLYRAERERDAAVAKVERIRNRTRDIVNGLDAVMESDLSGLYEMIVEEPGESVH